MLELNDILTSAADGCSAIEGIVRVVGISHDGQTVALIRLDVQPIQAPYNLSFASIDPDNGHNRVIRLETFDPGLASSKEDLSESARKHLGLVLEMMKSTMADTMMVMDAEYRGRELVRVAQQFKVHPRTIRRHFYNYLWGGMIELAYAGPQKLGNKERGRQSPDTKKRGPKPRNQDASKEGSLPLPLFRENLEKGARRFFFSGKHTEAEAFVLTKKTYYSRGKKASRTNAGNIDLEDLLLPPEQLPSPRQFHYVISVLRAIEGDRQDRPRTPPARKRSAQRGKARAGVPGPGYRFEIDATRIQIRIVSRFDPDQLIREATLYIIIDVWSGAIVGYALSIQPASWFLAAKALYNCFTPKGEVFKRLGLPYGDDAWLSHHLPVNLAADRGEFVGDKAGVVPEIGINVEIMPPMRPDRKGSVEGKFEDVKHGDNFYLKPGKHKKNLQRREKDGKKDAAFTLEELEATIVEIILDLNNDPVPIEHMPVDAVNAGVAAITYGGLFAWGLKNRPGFTRKLPPKVVMNELMLQDHGSVTPAGIRYKKQNYTSPALISSGLLEKAATQGSFNIKVRYDDLVGDRIRYFDPKLQDWADALNDNVDVQRLHASFWEIEEHLFKAQGLHTKAKENNISNRHEKARRVNKRAKMAIERAKAAKSPGSRSQSKQAIRLNTDIELAAERAKRLMAEQKSVATALAKPKSDENLSDKHERPHDEAPAAATKSVGQRTLELWKKKNASLD